MAIRQREKRKQKSREKWKTLSPNYRAETRARGRDSEGGNAEAEGGRSLDSHGVRFTFTSNQQYKETKKSVCFCEKKQVTSLFFFYFFLQICSCIYVFFFFFPQFLGIYFYFRGDFFFWLFKGVTATRWYEGGEEPHPHEPLGLGPLQ